MYHAHSACYAYCGVHTQVSTVIKMHARCRDIRSPLNGENGPQVHCDSEHTMARPRQNPSLVMDVLVMILHTFDEPVHVWDMMRTCKDLYDNGVCNLLRYGAYIRSNEQLRGFCYFILHDVPTRAAFLRELTLRILPAEDKGYDSDDSIGTDRMQVDDRVPDLQAEDEDELEPFVLLAIVLRSAHSLQRLRIACCEELLKHGDAVARHMNVLGNPLMDAFSSLQSLHHLQTASFGLRTFDSLSRLASPLVEVDVNLYSSDLGEFEDPGIDFLTLLASYRDTLQKLTLWHVGMESRTVQLTAQTPTFPHVHTLSLRKVMLISLPVLLHAFPHLHTLEVTDLWLYNPHAVADGIEDEDEDEDEDEEDDSIEGSVDIYRALNCAVDPVDAAWHTLQYLCGDLRALYVLGWRRHVPRVEITDAHALHHHAEMMCTILEDLRPVRLLVHMGQEGKRESVDHPECQLYDVLDTPATSQLTHLALDISASLYHDLATSDDEGNRQNPVASLITRMPLVSLVVRVHSDDFDDLRDREDCPEYSEVEHRTMTSRFAGLCSLYCASLVHIAVTLSWTQTDYWQITGWTTTGPMLALLSPEEGADLVREHQLEFRQRRKFIDHITYKCEPGSDSAEYASDITWRDIGE